MSEPSLSERIQQLIVAAEVAVVEKGCGDPDCCEHAFAQTAALEALARAIKNIKEALVSGVPPAHLAGDNHDWN